MISESRTRLDLVEYEPGLFDRDKIPDDVGRQIWQDHKSKLEVVFPSPVTDYKWKLTSQGWIGYIPASEDFSIVIQPKVPLSNLFRMLEYAYDIDWLGAGMTDLKSLKDFYESIAKILALRFMDRARKGLYRSYVDECRVLPFVRGRMDIDRLIQKPWEPEPKCHYQKHTPDIEDNQLIAWTLFIIARSGLCERTLPIIRKAYRATHGIISLRQFHPADCKGRLYHRLNEDYKPLHALCRFFLEHTGPSHEIGNRTMLPFLIDMNRLFEAFVEKWLTKHLSDRYSLRAQETVNIGDGVNFRIDLVLYDSLDGQPLCVLDTKYKNRDKPSPEDIMQVVAYAESKGCTEAVLIYPIGLTSPLDVMVGKIRVRALGFDLSGELDEMGRKLITGILPPTQIPFETAYA